ncbi:MAG: family 78 glycoside hydrolase catalytic domain [Opitutales bacterium]|nr:family 78 glycoside hydrolase catalytic domain [Opitutales bacterium]
MQFIILLFLSLIPVTTWSITVKEMTVNGRTNPLGISGNHVSLSWNNISNERGVYQSAYQILIGTNEGGKDIWDTGMVASDRQIDISLPKDIRLDSAKRYYWQVRAWDQNGKASNWSKPSWFETGLLSPQDWCNAKWIGPERSKDAEQSLPLFRKKLNISKAIQSVRLYASAHGVYQVSINGQKVGAQYLAPGWTDYTKRIQFQTYDITSEIHIGENVIGAALTDGWYKGKVGLNWREVYGSNLALIALIKIEYADGTVEHIVTDQTWKTSQGPFVQADLQDGETYDARLEQMGWDRKGFDDSLWRKAKVFDDDLSKLVPQPDSPIKILETLDTKQVTEPFPGEYVYDLGQNMVGVARVRITGKQGQTVRIRYAEEIYRTGKDKGRIYTDNFRTAKVTDYYTFARDESIVYQPTFTQHGFRYIEITGVNTPPQKEEVKGVVLGSRLQDTGALKLPHPMLNQLISNIYWGQRSNFLSIPTDTPARDERLGWTGDINVFAPTACRFQDTRAFLSKWMDDVRDAQKPSGNIPAIIPQPNNAFDETGVGWSDAFITIPYSVWRSTGDTSILRNNWESMKRFYAFVYESATHDGNLLEEGRSSWFSGDWLNLEDADRLEEHKVIATAYFAENTMMMSEMADALGEKEKATQWYELSQQIRDAFCRIYRNEDGSIYTGTQTVYAMALGMKLITSPMERKQTAEKFIEKLHADNYHLKTGFLGTPWLLPALSEIGRNDLAMKLLLNTDYPSWGYEISMGATTMWERWNTIQADGSFGPVEMNSFNHYAYGAVGDWIFQHLGGIQILEPGYKQSHIEPLYNALKESSCSLQTAYGTLSVDWKQTDTSLEVSVVIPVNTTSDIVIPCKSITDVYEGDSPAITSAGVSHYQFKEGKLILTTGSGTYQFRTSLK